MGDEARGRTAPHRSAELNTWAIIYSLLGWLSLAAAILGGAGEARYYLLAGVTLLPLSIGFWFRWSWARWAGFLLFALVAIWAVWQLSHQRVIFLSVALLLTSAETLCCLWRWPPAVTS